jgi:hypothetical protein
MELACRGTAAGCWQDVGEDERALSQRAKIGESGQRKAKRRNRDSLSATVNREKYPTDEKEHPADPTAYKSSENNKRNTRVSVSFSLFFLFGFFRIE